MGGASTTRILKVEKKEISSANIDWVSLIRQVARDQVTIELADGPTAIAEVVPKKRPFAIKGLPALMAAIPSLGEDAPAFARDIEESRTSFEQDADPWES
jgi:hypothetical protein